MAAPMSSKNNKPKHHVRHEVCLTRASYRDGRKPTAVKVYTVHQESRYLLVQGVPIVGASRELVRLFEVYGDLEDHRLLEDYPGEQFQEVHFFKYKKIQSARFAKKKLDDWSFYGGVIHVCYAPEYESIEDTRQKLRERQRIIEAKVRQYKKDGTYDLYPHANQQSTNLQQVTTAENHRNHHHQGRQQSNRPPWQQHRSYEVSTEQKKHTSQSMGVQQTSQYADEDSARNRYSESDPNTNSHRNIEQLEDASSSFSIPFTGNKPEDSVLQTALRESLTSVPYHAWMPVNSSHQSDSVISNNGNVLHFNLVPSTPSHTLPPNVRQSNNKKPTRNTQLAVEQARAMQFYGKRSQTHSYQTLEPSVDSFCQQETNERDSSQLHLSVHSENPNKTIEPKDSLVQKSDSVPIKTGATSRVVTEIKNKRKTSESSVISDENLTDRETNVNRLEDRQLILPPPPKQRKTGFRLNQPSYSTSLARVPSAQATFPPGFDARLNVPELPKAMETEHSNEEKQSFQVSNIGPFGILDNSTENKGGDIPKSRIVCSKQNQKSDKEVILSSNLNLQQSCAKTTDINSSPKTNKPNIPVPRFVPRQAVPKKMVKNKTLSTSAKPSTGVDTVNKELRQNALKLGRVQGPEYVTQNSERKNNTADQSVNKTVKDIRKKLKEIT